MQQVEAGATFGRLTVIEVSSSSRVVCKCSCGNPHTATASNLRHGKTHSCGCIRLERNNHTTHGASGTLTHKRWRSMRARCLNPGATNYPQYGGAGVKICARWDDFSAFLADLGECPSPAHTLDRIENGKGYEPGNCRWATRTEQARNQRTNRVLTHEGESLNLSAWAERLGLPAQTILNRLRYGWSIEKALTTKGDARACRRKPRANP